MEESAGALMFGFFIGIVSVAFAFFVAFNTTPNDLVKFDRNYSYENIYNGKIYRITTEEVGEYNIEGTEVKKD